MLYGFVAAVMVYVQAVVSALGLLLLSFYVYAVSEYSVGVAGALQGVGAGACEFGALLTLIAQAYYPLVAGLLVALSVVAAALGAVGRWLRLPGPSSAWWRAIPWASLAMLSAWHDAAVTASVRPPF